MEGLQDLDFAKAVLFVIPGALFTLSRSFTIRGVFPTVSKDDVAAFIVTSVIYHFVLLSLVSQRTLALATQQGAFADVVAALTTIVVPSLLGIASGVIEAGDVIGKGVRGLGLTFRSPTQTAWETLFTELQPESFLLVTLTDGRSICGRWIKGSRLSAASTDTDKMDLFIAEIGELNAQDKYLPSRPARGIYLPAGEIRSIEVV